MYKKICVIGEGITSLLVTNMLLDCDLEVDLLSESFFKKQNQDNRSFAISYTNFKYLNYLNLLNKKICSWNINKINLFNQKDSQDAGKIFDFKNEQNNPLFVMVEYKNLIFNLKNKMMKNSSLKIYSKKSIGKILKNLVNNTKKSSNDYSLIINCNNSNIINNKFFFKKIKKNYFSVSFTSTVKHKKIKNKIASQFFMKQGPMAFLPLSNSKTSVVWSVGKKYLSSQNKINYNLFKEKIKKNALNNFKIISFSKINQFNLYFSVPREYYYKNILSFGEALHQIHPLSGQGLNMIIRDIKLLSSFIRKKIDLGLDLNISILKEFSDEIKSYNYLFSKSIDLTEKYFSINNKFFNKASDQLLKNINKNIILKNILTDIADKGINIKNY